MTPQEIQTGLQSLRGMWDAFNAQLLKMENAMGPAKGSGRHEPLRAKCRERRAKAAFKNTPAPKS